MLIAADLFESIIATMSVRTGPGCATTSPSGGGQRRGPRVPVSSRLTVLPFAPGAEGLLGLDFPKDASGALKLPLGDPQSVPVRDLSRGGVRFLMPRRLPLETPFVLMLPKGTAGKEAPIAIESSVTYWQPINRELFAIGAQFHRVLEGFVAPSITPITILPNLDDAATLAALRPAV